MYRKFYGLAEPPFNLTPDSRYLYLSKRHREALAAVLYGIDEQKGFIVLTGAIGAGKTTICRALLTELDAEGARVAVILNSFLNDLELLQAINDEFKLVANTDSRKTLNDALNAFLLQQRAEGRTVVVVIDEAQHLSRETLEQVRMLSNLETEREKLIQIVLIGQPELNDILAQPALEQLNQRITVRYHLTPLTLVEMKQYIRHRLFVAQARIEIEWTPEALDAIYRYSGGIPRKINLACDRALLAGYTDGVYVIDESLARRAIAELKGVSANGDSGEAPAAPARRFQFSAPSAAIALLVFALVCVGGAIGTGLYMAGRPPRPPETAAPEPAASGASQMAGPAARPSAPGLSDAPEASDGGLQMPSLQIQSESTSAPAAAQPTPPPPRVRTPEFLAWVFQEREIWGSTVRFLQVDEENQALSGAFLTLLAAWGENAETHIEALRRGGSRACLALIDRYRGSGRDRRFVALDGRTFHDALEFDVPLLLELDDAAAQNPAIRLAPFVVLLRAQGEAMTVADPFSGLRTLRKSWLSRHVTGISVLYMDTHGWASLTRGEESEAVASLQRFLRAKKFFGYAVSGVYDSRLETAIQNFQKHYRIEQTGGLDEITVALMAIMADAGRPRLF